MINKITGEITIKNITVGPKFKQKDLRHSKLNDDVISKDEDIYTNYYLKLQKIGEHLFVVRILFDRNENLSEVLLSISLDGKIPSWEDWSEESQLLKKEKNDEWLHQTIGYPPYEFDWGKITSVYDFLSGSSYIKVLYKNSL